MPDDSHPAYSVDWSLIRSFDAVARSGSLAAGARLLGVAHPTIARHIQQLEEQLGTTLFDRSSQGLVINAAGERLKAAAADMQVSALQFQNVADGLEERPLPRVRITVSELLAELLPHLARPAMASLGETLPSVDMIVTHEALNLLEREADIALRHMRPTQQELVCRRLGDLPLGLYASEAYVQQHGLVDNESVGLHRFVDTASRDTLVSGARAQGLMIEPHQVAFRSDALSCQRAAMVAGWGVGAMPTTLASEVDGLVSAMEEERAVDLDVWLVARSEVRENLQLKRVFDGVGDALVEQLRAASMALEQPVSAHPHTV